MEPFLQEIEQLHLKVVPEKKVTHVRVAFLLLVLLYWFCTYENVNFFYVINSSKLRYKREMNGIISA